MNNTARTATLRGELAGELFERGDRDYEAQRQRVVWNGYVPPRFPDAIVRAATVDDVVRTVKFASGTGQKIATRAGGHSWAGSFLRDGGILLDVGGLDAVSVDVEGRRALVGPGRHGAELMSILAQDDLFFPGGHCATVALGGFLLAGGFGWGSRVFGPACESIRSIQVVTAEGAVVRADAHSHADLLWAARGSGPGFFGVVTEFELDLQALPRHLRFSSQTYGLEHLDAVLLWAAPLAPQLSPLLEMSVYVVGADRAGRDPIVHVRGTALAYTAEDASASLGILETCPVLPHATERIEDIETTFDELYASMDSIYSDGQRYAIDNIWSDASGEELLPLARQIVASLPQAPAHFMWQPYGRTQSHDDIAFSMEANLFLTAFSTWDREEQDDHHQRWVAESMRILEPLGRGMKAGDAFLEARPFRIMSDENFEALERMRRRYDPDGRFHSYIRAPGASH